MSAITPKEVLAKNLQKSHSSSSLLLTSANLSWTPTASAILAAPQPPIERPASRPSSESSKGMTNEELIQALRTDGSTATSTQSLDILDGFQTISLSDAKADDNSDQRSVDSFTSNLTDSSAPTSSQQKLSLLDQLFTSVSVAAKTVAERTSGRTSGRTSPLMSDTTSMTAPPQFNPSSGGDHSAHHMSGSYSNQNFGSLSSNIDQSAVSSSSLDSMPSSNSFVPTQPTQPPLPSAPPQLPPPLAEPPKSFVVRDYRRKGPLRLYDPNHGLGQTSVGSTASPISESTFSPPTVTQFVPPVVSPAVEAIYNPIDITKTAQTIESNHENSNDSNDLPNTTIASNSDQNSVSNWPQDSNSQPFSFISEPQNQDLNYIPNTNEWPQIARPDRLHRPVPDPSAPPGDQQYTDQQQYYRPMTDTYQPVEHHWFYQKIIENKEVWLPFSMYDSYNLEQGLISSGANNGYGMVIPTDGGRFDVSIYERLRRPVYWSEVDTVVRRCSWFYKKEGHNRWAPYPEDFATKLEESYREAMANNQWNKTIEFDSGSEVVVMHSQQGIYHYQRDNYLPDGWGQAMDNPNKPRHVQRGALTGIFDDIDEGEPEKIDHLVFLIHGIGELCDLSFRSIVEVVDDFRAISLSQMRTHYKSYLESGQLGRIELLPISWHSALHGDQTGIDDRLKQITLESIPRLRHFSNDTILDALFYTSPVYCQTIVNSVGEELNRLFALFCQRNPNFSGTIALGGHSLGSLIVFDILAHQKPNDKNSYPENTGEKDSQSGSDQTLSPHEKQMCEIFSHPDHQTIELLLTTLGFADYISFFRDEQRLEFQTILVMSEQELKERCGRLPTDVQVKLSSFLSNFKQFSVTTRKMSQSSVGSDAIHQGFSSPINSYPFEALGLGFPAIQYPKLSFHPSAFFAIGSPIPMFLTVRGVEYLSPDYRLPTCPAVYNIFHPYDPIAYRLEPMIYRAFKDIKPVLIPHHKGRKRMHLELRDSIVRMGSDIKSKIYDSLKYTWNSIHEFARAHKANAINDSNDSVNKEEEYREMDANDDLNQTNYSINADYEDSYGQQLSAGALNNGRRIDYVLQESPVEAFNEYLFAIRAHTCYWQSEDTALLVLRELYGQMGYYSTQPTVGPQSQNNTNSEQQQQVIPSSASNHSLDYSQTGLELSGHSFISN